eukprot:COSAG05_NODE_15953_length_357_cov_0.763566_1_plen_23_part_10
MSHANTMAMLPAGWETQGGGRGG